MTNAPPKSDGVVVCVNFSRCLHAGKHRPAKGTPTIACHFCMAKVPRSTR